MKKNVIIISAVILGLIIALLTISSTSFKISRTTPNNDKFPSSLGSIQIYFNKKLAVKQLQEAIENNPDQVLTTTTGSAIKMTVSEESVTIEFTRTPGQGLYEIRLNNIVSENGDRLQKTIPLVIKNIPYDKLSKEDRALYDAFAADAETKDSDYQILEFLPRKTSDYTINYEMPHDHSESEDPSTHRDDDMKPLLIVTMNFFVPGTLAVPATPEQKQEYLDKIRKYRKEALEFIGAQGRPLTDYRIHYTEPDLRSEFPQGTENYPVNL